MKRQVISIETILGSVDEMFRAPPLTLVLLEEMETRDLILNRLGRIRI